jgi:two-component system nitrogen regulation response regulator NtrX
VFLEDVDTLPEALQERIAGWLTSRPDVRLLASASSDAAGLTSSLRKHLDVVRIQVPPLRERREDIREIVHRFQRDLSREYGRPDRTFGSEALGALVRHDWPGNLRELRNAVERIVLLAGAEVSIADLPSQVGGEGTEIDDLYRPFGSLEEGVRAFERYFLRRLLREAKGDVAVAARRAGLSTAELRKTLG